MEKRRYLENEVKNDVFEAKKLIQKAIYAKTDEEKKELQRQVFEEIDDLGDALIQMFNAFSKMEDLYLESRKKKEEIL